VLLRLRQTEARAARQVPRLLLLLLLEPSVPC
jgi:hypothetical protein